MHGFYLFLSAYNHAFLPQAKTIPQSTSTITSAPVSSSSLNSNIVAIDPSQPIPSSFPLTNAPSAAIVHVSRQSTTHNHEINDEVSNKFTSDYQESSAQALAQASGEHSTIAQENEASKLLKGQQSVRIVHPAINRPILQSSRLIVTESSLKLSKTYTKKLNSLLQDLGAPDHPLPTKTVCDLYDQVRQEGIMLIALNNEISKKEKQLNEIRSHQKNFLGLDSFDKGDLHD